MLLYQSRDIVLIDDSFFVDLDLLDYIITISNEFQTIRSVVTVIDIC